jgi:hypothetical protein
MNKSYLLYSCCFKEFRSISGLKQHELRQKGTRRYNCELYGRVLWSWSSRFSSKPTWQTSHLNLWFPASLSWCRFNSELVRKALLQLVPTKVLLLWAFICLSVLLIDLGPYDSFLSTVWCVSIILNITAIAQLYLIYNLFASKYCSYKLKSIFHLLFQQKFCCYERSYAFQC